MNYDNLLNLGTELGYQLMFSGAEIYRVEESVYRLLTAYGLQPQIFAIPNCLIVSLDTPDGHSITKMRRIPSHGTDIELLETCNALCRRLCQETPPVDEAMAQLKEMTGQHRTYSIKLLLLGYTTAAAFFAAFFGGGLTDVLSAACSGLAVGLWMLYLGRKFGLNGFIQTLFGAVVASMMAMLMVKIGIGQSLEAITIGTLMVLVPGMALTNAMREIMAGDIFSGMSRTADAILAATAISLGVVISLAIGM